MNGAARLLLLAELGLIAFLVARARARDRPVARQHGVDALAWTVLPALALLVGWALVAPGVVTYAVLAAPAAAALPADLFERGAVLAQARAGILHWHPLAATLAPVYARAQAIGDWLATAAMLVAAALGFGWSGRRQRAGRSPQVALERLVVRALGAGTTATALIAIGLAAVLLWQSARFFAQVPAPAFLFGTHWAPQSLEPGNAANLLGALPLLWGSLFTGVVLAMLVAVPLGLLSAIWLSHYASPRARSWLRPLLELLAGIPTVIYGYWALLSLAPAIRSLGLGFGLADPSSESALTVGVVLGLLATPIVTAVSADALAAVPDEIADASLAVGATTAETIVHALLPAAMPGIAGGVLLAVGRTVGETTIAVMVSSAAATISLDPFAPATSVPRQIVDLLTGEASFDGPKTLAAFALGLLLFAVTLGLNLLALRVMHRNRHAPA